MILDLDRQIEQAEMDASVKVILRQIISALNTLHESQNTKRADIVFKDDEKGIVLIAPDGNYWRATFAVSGATVDWQFTSLGKKV